MDKYGNKTGGRQKGGLNRDKRDLRDAINTKLRELGYLDEGDEFDAVVMLATIAIEAFSAKGDDRDINLALRAAAEVAKYTRPQLRSIVMAATVEERKEVDLSPVVERFDELAGGRAPLIEGVASEVTH